MKPVTTSFLLATLALSVAQYVCAGDTADTPAHLVVSYAGVDLSTTAGAKLVYGRLHAAAKQVCSPLDREGDLNLAVRYRTCVQTAMSNAIQQLDKPLLTDLFIERTRGPQPVKIALAK